MFTSNRLDDIRQAIDEQTRSDRRLLDELLSDVRSIRSDVRTIKRRTTTSISLVASDGGNNKLAFDPFLMQVVRIVDSLGAEEMLDVISPTLDPDDLVKRHLDNGVPKTALGRLMADLSVATLVGLSHMIPKGEKVRTRPNEVSPTWVLTFRDICEWAVLYERLCVGEYATNTLFVRDGLLRSKQFAGELFIEMIRKIETCVAATEKERKRKLFLVGIAKHSQVLSRYRLAMTIENLFPTGDAYYVPIPREIERKAYRWPEYARGEGDEEGGEAAKFVGGRMFFVRFGPHRGDPVWAIDLLSSQAAQASEIFGFLLGDAVDGFPVPYYPRCLQKAHEFAEVVDFDLAVLQDSVLAAVRKLLDVEDQSAVDRMNLDPDPSGRRYE